MKRTKIICTIGPASEDINVIKDLINNGMDVARLNLSHGALAEQEKRIEKVRRAAEQLDKMVGILADTRGPEIRIKEFAGGEVELQKGDSFTLTTRDVTGDKTCVGVTYADLPQDVEKGGKILLDDGMIELEVRDISSTDVETVVTHGGKLLSGKGINLPGMQINMPYLSERDRKDIQFAIKQDVDFIAASFVRRPGDVLSVKSLVEEAGAEVQIIAKIENREGVDNFDEILEVSDGVMVARGDLGVEIPAEDVPLVQKDLISGCNRHGKIVITATQMLDSMIRNPRPTRAEASDVANAIFDGTDAVMLSGETAVGAFPREAVHTMVSIASRTEDALEYERILQHQEPGEPRTITDVISYATCRAAHDLGAAAIISATQSGYTARMVSKYKPSAPIVAVTPSKKVCGTLTLAWGVYPLLSPPTGNTDEIFSAGIRVAMEAGVLESGEMVIFTAGVPVGVPGTTNFLRIETVGEVIIQGQGVGRSVVTGSVHIANSSQEALLIEKGQVLVVQNTDKEYVPAMEKASAVITEAGGLTSHAAIVGLHLGKPVVVGAEGAINQLSPGEMVTVETRRGLIYRGRAAVT